MKTIKKTGWLAKDLKLGANTYLFLSKPIVINGVFVPSSCDKLESIPVEDVEGLYFENSPVEVEVTIKKRKREWF